MKTSPTLEYEKKLWSQGITVLGVDEVGRGCLAGPLYVCASYFEPAVDSSYISYLESLGINDSKKLTPTKRRELYKMLKKEQFHFSIGIVSPAVIDLQGLTDAVKIATIQAVEPLLSNHKKTKLTILYDGSLIHSFPAIDHQIIIKGDSLSLTIAAASIMAKVERDAYMDQLAKDFPLYNWNSNKGYGTAEHIAALKKYGKSSHHRNLFLRKIK